MDFSEEDLFANAAMLMSDDGENPEYDRALVELIASLTGDDVEDVAARLEQMK